LMCCPYQKPPDIHIDINTGLVVAAPMGSGKPRS
jgi:hypothetical protein